MPLRIRKPKFRSGFVLPVIAFCLIIFASALSLTAGANASVSSSTTSPSLAIDGSNINEMNASTISLTISTTQSSDVIVLVASIFTNTSVTAVPKDAQGLTWIPRTNIPPTNYDAELLEFYAISAVPLSGDKVTLTLSAQKVATLKIFGISGANTTSPFDAGLPTAANSGGDSSPTVSVATTNPNDMILGIAYIKGSPNITAGPGFSCIAKNNTCTKFGSDPLAFAEYLVVSSPQSLQVSATLSGDYPWVMFGDAVQGLTPTTTTTTTSSSSTSTSSSTSQTITSSTTTSSTTTPSAPPPTTTSTTTATTTSSSKGNSGGPISLTLAAIIAVVIIVAAIGASLFVRRRPTQ